jgi:hypothetical protein
MFRSSWNMVYVRSDLHVHQINEKLSGGGGGGVHVQHDTSWTKPLDGFILNYVLCSYTQYSCKDIRGLSTLHANQTVPASRLNMEYKPIAHLTSKAWHLFIYLFIYWIGHILRRNCLLKQVTEGKTKGQIEVTRRRGRGCKNLLDDLGDRRGYCHLKEEALDRTKWRNRFGRGCGPVVWQITDDDDIYQIQHRILGSSNWKVLEWEEVAT